MLLSGLSVSLSTYRAQLMALSFGERLRICIWDRCSTGRDTTVNESDARRFG